MAGLTLAALNFELLYQFVSGNAPFSDEAPETPLRTPCDRWSWIDVI
jgi:hypothetical protein